MMMKENQICRFSFYLIIVLLLIYNEKEKKLFKKKKQKNEIKMRLIINSCGPLQYWSAISDSTPLLEHLKKTLF